MTLGTIASKILFRARYQLWRALKSVSKPNRMYSFLIDRELRFEYPLDSAIGRHLFAGDFETAEIAFFRSELKPGNVVLDVGANGGLYTIIAARVIGPEGRVYAFEPGPEALALLRHNVEINQLTNVTIIEAAVSNKTGEASFGIASDSALSSLVNTDRADQKINEWSKVTTIRLDDAVEKYEIPRVDFIKVDVEGAEGLVIDGCGDLLSRRNGPMGILFEAFDNNCSAFGYTVPELLTDLRMRGFELKGFEGSALVPIEQVHTGIGTRVYNFVALKK